MLYPEIIYTQNPKYILTYPLYFHFEAEYVAGPNSVPINPDLLSHPYLQIPPSSQRDASTNPQSPTNSTPSASGQPIEAPLDASDDVDLTKTVGYAIYFTPGSVDSDSIPHVYAPITFALPGDPDEN